MESKFKTLEEFKNELQHQLQIRTIELHERQLDIVSLNNELKNLKESHQQKLKELYFEHGIDHTRPKKSPVKDKSVSLEEEIAQLKAQRIRDAEILKATQERYTECWFKVSKFHQGKRAIKTRTCKKNVNNNYKQMQKWKTLKQIILNKESSSEHAHSPFQALFHVKAQPNELFLYTHSISKQEMIVK